jgi:hypothetical protein
MFLLPRYTVAAAVFLSASAASAVEDATLSADRMLPACTAFIRENAPGDVDGVFEAGRCIGLMQGLGFASRLFGVCPPDEVTLAQKSACGRYIRRGASRADARRFSSSCSRGDAEGLAVQVTERGRLLPRPRTH